ncbi:hypothetical protein [Salinisphaera orenii]|uniref:hypothetical protein n=1 Tax=Salinisphaera orenii TaxID=856731 RepID=UPI00161FDA01|nr:hypothetical protein [Salinisphaera halophila]
MAASTAARPGRFTAGQHASASTPEWARGRESSARFASSGHRVADLGSGQTPAHSPSRGASTQRSANRHPLPGRDASEYVGAFTGPQHANARPASAINQHATKNAPEATVHGTHRFERVSSRGRLTAPSSVALHDPHERQYRDHHDHKPHEIDDLVHGVSLTD